MTRPTRGPLAAILVTLAALGGLLVAQAPAQAAWSCSDGACHGVTHWAADDGYNGAIPVLCGNNLIRYDIAMGHTSQGDGCNDVNRIGAKPGHATRCYINGTWITMAWQYPDGSGLVWSSYLLQSGYAGTSYLCVDGKTNNGDLTGGQGGGGGGGGTW